MATPDILDFEALLAPIEGDNEAGIDLRADAELSAVYYQVRDARSQARSLERQAIRDGEELPKMLDEWRTVIQQGTEVLTNSSKSLEIVAWLIEALLRRDGFAGLRDGYRLARELAEKYWDNVYPLPDEDGVSTRVAALVGLTGEDGPGALEEPFINVEVTQAGSYGPFRVWHYQQAADLAAIADEQVRQERIDAGAVSMEQFETAARESSHDYFRNLIADIDEAKEEYAKFCEVLEAKCEDYYFPTSNVRNGLIAAGDTVASITRDILPPEITESDDSEAGDTGAAGGPAPAARRAGGPIQSRADALKTLLEVANFFVRTEPHSPISYSVRQVVRWAQLPLPRLLEVLIPDDGAREGYFKLVGISEGDDGGGLISDDAGGTYESEGVVEEEAESGAEEE